MYKNLDLLRVGKINIIIFVYIEAYYDRILVLNNIYY